MRRFFFCLIVNFGALSLAAQAEIKILFIGNSLTYTNNLPKMVVAELASSNVKASTQSLAYPNYGLEDHWNDGILQKRIEQDSFDYVVIQQGPSSQEYGRNSLIEYGGKIAQECSASGARLIYFMVWPSRLYFNTYEGVIMNHKDAAKINNALLAAAGELWKAYFDKKKKFDLYGSDGFHPSKKGSRVAAEEISKVIIEHWKNL